jgi:hypothetical protein
VVPEGDHIMVLDKVVEDDMNDIVSRKIVHMRDMSIARSVPFHKDYDVRHPLTSCRNHMLSYRQVCGSDNWNIELGSLSRTID